MIEMRQKLMPADITAISAEEDSIGILLETVSTNGLPSKVTRIRLAELRRETLVIFEESGGLRGGTPLPNPSLNLCLHGLGSFLYAKGHWSGCDGRAPFG